MRNSQLRYAIIYVIITALALCFLNIYAARSSRNLVFRANESAVMERARVIAASFQDLDSVTEEAAQQAVLVLGPQSYDRIVITAEAGFAVFDSLSVGNETGAQFLLPSVVQALEGSDVFYSRFRSGLIECYASVPIMYFDVPIGAVYLMVCDSAQGALLKGLEATVLRLSLILALCLFNSTIMRTRLGQKFRAVGQSQTVANASGINVDRTRVIAIMISTVLAGWGQIVFMQSEGIGTFQTYAAHEQVGLYAGAAILVGGASIDRATNLQALVGTFLFHSLFITAQSAASVMFGDSAVGEYFRAFLSYGVIAVALIMYAWRSANQKKAGQLDLRSQGVK